MLRIDFYYDKAALTLFLGNKVKKVTLMDRTLCLTEKSSDISKNLTKYLLAVILFDLKRKFTLEKKTKQENKSKQIIKKKLISKLFETLYHHYAVICNIVNVGSSSDRYIQKDTCQKLRLYKILCFDFSCTFLSASSKKRKG